MKILLLGSPSISVNAFEQVINNFEVVGIVTQPDRPKGRGMQMQQTAVADLGDKHGIKVFKPAKISSIKEELKELNFDLMLTFAFGQWIPTSLLKMGKKKPLNIHGSLLPKYRGAAPIHYAILNGDEEIGITLMEMVKEMDAGDMVFKASRKISDQTTTGEAFDIVDELATQNIVAWLKEVEANKETYTPQGDDFSLSPKIEKSYGELKSDLTMEETMRKIKGLNPFPGSFAIIDNKRIKIFNASTENINNSVELKCKDGSLFANEYQRESKKRIVL